MNVSELARRAGVTAKAVRFYEAEGILPAAQRAPNGYRTYGEEDVCRLRLVATLRDMGIALTDSGRLAGLCVSDRCDVMEDQLVELIKVRRADVRARRRELAHLERELAALQAGLSGTAAKRHLCTGKEVVG